MRRAGLAACIVLGVLVSSVCLGAEVSADNSGPVMEIQIANNTGRTIREIFVLPSGMSKWPVKDLINGSSPLRDGKSMTITIGRKFRYWDLIIRFSGGKKQEWHEIDMWSDIRQIEITSDMKLMYRR